MAKIKVLDIKSASADIKPAGAELFGDSESFINDLKDNELTVAGGFKLIGFPSQSPNIWGAPPHLPPDSLTGVRRLVGFQLSWLIIKAKINNKVY